MYIDKKSYLNYAKDYNVIPICKEIRADFETPISLFLKLKANFLLESVERGTNVGRYSIISLGKKTSIRMNGKEIIFSEFKNNKLIDEKKFILDNPLIKIREYFKSFKVLEYESLPPFYGGAIGFLGYETVQYFENIPVKENKSSIPDGLLIIPEAILVFDIVKRYVSVIIPSYPNSDPEKNYEESLKKFDQIIDLISKPLENSEKEKYSNNIHINNKMAKEYFIKSINRCKEYIREGDIIQAVFSQQFEVKTGANPFELYRTLRIINPSPYLFFLDFDEFQIIGSSPEVMVRVENKEILLKPIAGTKKRGNSIAEDNLNTKELLEDPKERAEHIMLVDLGRNDLGRIATPGSVEVSDYMTIEKYSHVMHIVSTIKAELDEHFDVFDVIRATFPAGTLSGAPKIRAMQIIDELEPVRRGPYGGMILNLGYNLNLDSCITIRTILLKDGVATIQTGAGIVADSDPENEYNETINKARALINTIEQTKGRESI